MKFRSGAGFALFGLCAFYFVPQTESFLIVELFKVASMTFSSVYHTWDLFEGKLQPSPDSPHYQEKTLPEEYVMKDHPSFYINRDEHTLMARINEINRKIAEIEERLKEHEEIIITKLEQLPHAIMTEMKVNQVLDIVRDVESRYETFSRYTKLGVIKPETGKTGLDRLTVLNFAQFSTSHSQESPMTFLDRLHSILVPHFDSDKLLGSKSFFYTFKDFLNFLRPSAALYDQPFVYNDGSKIVPHNTIVTQTVEIQVHFHTNKLFGTSYGLSDVELVVLRCVSCYGNEGNNTSRSRMWRALVSVILLAGAAEALETPRQITGIDIIRGKVINRISELWKETENWQILAKRKSGLDAELVKEFRTICEFIDFKKYPEVPHVVADKIWTYALIDQEQRNILGTYGTFKKLQARPDPVIFGDLWKQFAGSVLVDRPNTHSSILKTLAIIQEMIDDGIEGHKNIFQAAFENQEEFTCDVNQSPQQLLFNLYTTFQLTQLKAYTMVHFSWMLLRLYDQGNFTVETELLKTSYLERMSQQALALKAVMKDSKNDMWACDPKQDIEGETFVKITKFLQGYIVNEVDLNGDNTCRENCAFYKYGKQQGCFKDQFCANQPVCHGNVVGCKFVDSDMWICQSPHFEDRRYDWIEYENGRTLGQRQSCKRAVKKVDSWWRYLFWHCSYCFCFCDDPKDPGSDRFFSLRSVTVDTDKNKVTTGMRFVKLNRIIHLQLQQGELLHHGEINETTVEWIPVKEFGIKDEGVEVGKDYHMLTWEHKAFDLDDIKLPKGHVLTGIRIRRLGGHMNVEIQGTEFNYTTGKLTHNGSKSQWFGNDNTDGSFHQPRAPQILQNPDVPTKSTGLNRIDSRPDTYIEFTASDSDLDVAQTTVPFIDAQAVAPHPPIALVGAGVFHKGRRYSGGFIGLKVFTYNQGENVQDVFPDVNETEF